ncbi:MAG: FtsW/RodA/SpoVE family cell cycle protein [Sedimentisphaeraceae bacterium JB056]
MEKKSIDYGQFLAMIAFVLIGIGIVFVCSAQANVSNEFSFRRVYFSFGGVIAVLVFSLIPYEWFNFPTREEFYESVKSLLGQGSIGRFRAFCRLVRYSILPVFMIIVAAALLYVLLGPVRAINASRRWLILFEGSKFEIRMQPSELIKLAVVFFEAAYIVHFGHILRKFTIYGIIKAVIRLFKGDLTLRKSIRQTLLIIPFFAVPGFYVALIAIEDFGTAAFIAMVMFLMLVVAQTPYWQLFTGTVVGIAGSYYYISQEQYRMNRIIAFMDLEKATEAIKYQIVNSMTAISTGGVFGKGLGRGVYKWGYVPEDKTDFIFSIICEEIGVVGAGFVILLFILMLMLGFIIAIKCRDPLGKVLAVGLSCAICLQAFVNIGVVTSSLPTTGIPLPFVSAGGSSLLASSLAVGLLMNIARKTARQDIGLMEPVDE